VLLESSLEAVQNHFECVGVGAWSGLSSSFDVEVIEATVYVWAERFLVVLFRFVG